MSIDVQRGGVLTRRPLRTALAVVLVVLALAWFSPFEPPRFASSRDGVNATEEYRSARLGRPPVAASGGQLDGLSTLAGSTVQTLSKGERSSIRCALQDGQSFHGVVWAAALESLSSWGCDLRLYHKPYRYNLGGVTERLWEHERDRPLQPEGSVVEPLRKGEVDLLVITTGDDKWLNPAVLEAVTYAHKTQVVLIMHVMFNMGPERERLRQIAKEGRLTLLCLGESTTRILSHMLSEWAAEDAETGWDRVPVERFVPIFPVPRNELPRHKIPSRVVIQGKVEYHRRNYERIFNELQMLLPADPAPWGYHLPTIEGSKALEPIPGHKDVFTLHLLGTLTGPLPWPEELNNVIVVHSGQSYDEFYHTLGSMDLLLPAFAGFHYLRDQTSSSIPAAVIGRVPVLASGLAVKIYEYLVPPAIVPYPAGMTEVGALKLLREGKPLWDSEADLYLDLETTRRPETFVQSPIDWSYAPDTPATRAAWDAYHAKLYADNARIWDRTARRLVRQRRWAERHPRSAAPGLAHKLEETAEVEVVL